jgi:large subunit ribosomal protein L3
MINLQIMKIVKEKNLVLVKGSVPGPNGSYIKIERWS